MSVAPHSGVIDFGTFTPPSGSTDGIQGEVPQPLASQVTYFLSATGWAPVSGGGSGTVTSVNVSGDFTGLTFTGGPITTSGTITMGGTLGAGYGGTSQSTYTTGDILYASATNTLSKLPIGTTNYVLTVIGGVPQWAASTGGVTSFSAGTTGFTPSTASTGAITLSGTLNVANGGTGVTTSTGTGSVVLSTTPTLVTPILGAATATSLKSSIIYGGSSASSALTLQSTSGIGTTDSVFIKTGNNGGTINLTATSSGQVTVPFFATNSFTSTTPVLSFNALNSPIVSGATISGNYLQFVLQNQSGTTGASTNYVLSNDLGTDSSYYGEFGMNSSVYSTGTPSDFYSINNGVYFSGHDGDISVGSGNGYKLYFPWGSSGASAHVINTSGALGFTTNLGTTPTLSGTTGYGTSGQSLITAGSGAAPAWGALNLASSNNVSGTLSAANGGTGVNNGTNTITLGGSLTTSGAFATTLTVTGATNVTLPTTGTLAILGSNTFTNNQTITEVAGGSGLTITGATQTASNPVLNLTQTWNNSGITFTGIKLNVTNTASATSSLLIDLQVGGTSQLNLTSAGALTTAGSVIAGGTAQLGWSGKTRMTSAASGSLTFSNSALTNSFSLTAPTANATPTMQLGAADAAAPVAQIFSVQSVVAGTSNTAGQNFTIKGSLSTGSGTSGDIIVQTGASGAAATVQNTATTALTIKGVTQRVIAAKTIGTGGFTVATLPTGVTGDRTYVTDALTPGFGTTVTAGGAVTIPVFYNGSNWIVG
jgi:hypothetical protein